MSADPRVQHLQETARQFRETGERSLLNELQMHGDREVAHALMMEWVHRDNPTERAEHTQVVEAFLAL